MGGCVRRVGWLLTRWVAPFSFLFVGVVWWGYHCWFFIGLLRAWFFWVRGFLCVFGGCGCERLSRWWVSVERVGCFSVRFWGVHCVTHERVYFFFIPVGEGLSFFPSQRVMHLSVKS